MRWNAKDITGQKVGFLTVMSYAGSNGQKSVWIVRCICGREMEKTSTNLAKALKRGTWASCGCRRSQTISERTTRHGMSHHPAYAVWDSMLARCLNPKHAAWHNYGGRGITVCPQWIESFTAFWADMGPTYQQGLWIEREDNSGNYEAANCRWATVPEQCLNKRTNVRIQAPAGEMTVAEASRLYGIKVTTLLYRLAAGWTPEKACLTSPTAGRVGASLSAELRGR